MRLDFKKIFKFFLFTAFFCWTAVGYGEELPFSVDSPLETHQEETPTIEGHFFEQFIKMLFILCALIVAMLVLAWVAKKFLNTRLEQINAASGIRVEERRVLTQKTVVYILNVQGERVLLAESHQGVAIHPLSSTSSEA